MDVVQLARLAERRGADLQGRACEEGARDALGVSVTLFVLSSGRRADHPIVPAARGS